MHGEQPLRPSRIQGLTLIAAQSWMLMTSAALPACKKMVLCVCENGSMCENLAASAHLYKLGQVQAFGGHRALGWGTGS